MGVNVAKGKPDGKPAGDQPAAGDVATIKTKARVARALEQIAALRGVNKQDVLDAYVEQFEDDLQELLTARQAAKAAGVPYRNPHQLRHSWASNALARGYGIGDVAKYLGDSPATVARVYAHATDADPAAWVDEVVPVPGGIRWGTGGRRVEKPNKLKGKARV